MSKSFVSLLALSAAVLFCFDARAQQQAAPSYGSPGVNLEQAKKAVAAAEAEAKRNNWNMAIAVVSNGGYLVHFSKMDDTQLGSIQYAQRKANSATKFRRPTKVFEDRLAAGGAGLGVLALDGAVPSEGGIPIVNAQGKVIGAIGCSGGAMSSQDGQACQAGVNALK